MIQFFFHVSELTEVHLHTEQQTPKSVPVVRKRRNMTRLHGLGVISAHSGGTGAVLGISACPA